MKYDCWLIFFLKQMLTNFFVQINLTCFLLPPNFIQSRHQLLSSEHAIQVSNKRNEHKEEQKRCLPWSNKQREIQLYRVVPLESSYLASSATPSSLLFAVRVFGFEWHSYGRSSIVNHLMDCWRFQRECMVGTFVKKDLINFLFAQSCSLIFYAFRIR